MTSTSGSDLRSPVPRTVISYDGLNTGGDDDDDDNDYAGEPRSPLTSEVPIFPANDAAQQPHPQQPQPPADVIDHSLREPSTIRCPDTRSADVWSRFLTDPIPLGEKVFCRITRHRVGVGKRMYPTYTVALELGDAARSRQFVMGARKKKKSKTSTYVIYNCPLDHPGVVPTKQNVIGKVKSNFLGTEFIVYGRGRNFAKREKEAAGTAAATTDAPESLREELAVVLYEPNLLGFKGPRKMTIVIPSMTGDGRRRKIVPTTHAETMLEQMKVPMNDNILWLTNKSPQWNDENNSYVLNFNGRVTVASVKNFQVVHSNDIDYIVMQFGRVETMPPTPEQAQAQAQAMHAQAQALIEQQQQQQQQQHAQQHQQDGGVDDPLSPLSPLSAQSDDLPDWTALGPIFGVDNNVPYTSIDQQNFFSMDVQYPMSLLQCFGVCLTSFDAKLACE
ncbi:hypothetical protein RI367_007108 [Sorochytrium milnesiophthora]